MFGKTQRGVSERPNKPKKPLIPKWLGMLVAILAILCVAVMLMLWKPWQPVPAKNQVTSEHYQEEDTNKDSDNELFTARAESREVRLICDIWR